MKYVGIQSQIWSNNRKSILLLILFPLIILAVVWLFVFIMDYITSGSFSGNSSSYYDNNYYDHTLNFNSIWDTYLNIVPWVVGVVAVWFCIAYFFNTSMVRRATGAHSLTRKENPRVYNIVENLCIGCGMDMPKINIVEDSGLNAFASGIDKKSYTVTVTRGLLETLDDAELEGVIGHELTHIRNRDTRLLITSIIFVGIVYTVMTFIMRYGFRIALNLGSSRSSRNSKNGGGALVIVIMMLIALICSAIAYLFTILTRFAISRKREYMADAGGAELCGNPLALASALRKISAEPGLKDVENESVSQLYIIHPQKLKSGFVEKLSGFFATHPPTKRRIEILEQF